MNNRKKLTIDVATDDLNLCVIVLSFGRQESINQDEKEDFFDEPKSN